jgi:hypothetical protein
MKSIRFGSSFVLVATASLVLSGSALAAQSSKKIAKPVVAAEPEATVASYQADAAAAQTLQPAINASTSTKADNTASISSPLDRVYLGLTSTFHGAPIKNLGSEYSVDTTGKEKHSNYNTILFDSEIGAGYRLTKNIGIGPIVPFLAAPVRDQGFTLGDVGLKVFNSKQVNSGGLHIASNLMVQVPTSDSSRARGMTWALKTTPYGRYDIAKSNFTIGAFTEAKDYFGVTKDKTFKLWALPYVGYAFNDTLSARVAYEMEWHHVVGQKGLGFDTYMTDLQPGFVWNIAKGYSVNPYVQFYTMKSVDLDHTAVGAFLNASIL